MNSFNFDTTGTAYYVDPKYHMMLQINQLWDPTGDNGKGDSIGRTFESYYTYRDKRFIDAIKSCWVKIDNKNNYYYQGFRFPTHDSNDMSRDHLFNSVLVLIASGHTEDEIKEFVTHVPWKISDKYNQTLDLWLWMRSISGIWWAKVLSPIVDITLMSINVLWQKICYAIAPFKPELSQEEFCSTPTPTKTKWIKTIGSALFPSYTMTQVAWKIHFTKNSISKTILKWLLLRIANKHNYVVKLLLDDSTVTKEQVYSYKSMMGGRWDGILNPYINDRDLHIIDDTRYSNYKQLLSSNVLDVDLVRSIYENKLNNI
jgi:hypothetical protein